MFMIVYYLIIVDNKKSNMSVAYNIKGNNYNE